MSRVRHQFHQQSGVSNAAICLQTDVAADVAGATHERCELLARLGPASRPDGRALRRELRAKRLYLPRGRGRVGNWDYGRHGAFVYDRRSDRARAEAGSSLADAGWLLYRGWHSLVRELLSSALQPQPAGAASATGEHN